MLLQEFNARLSHGYFKSIKNLRDAIQWHVEKFDVVKRNVKLFERLRKDGNRTGRLLLTKINLHQRFATVPTFFLPVAAEIKPRFAVAGGLTNCFSVL